MLTRRLAALCLLLLGTALGACDRDVTDPTLADDQVEALLARAGVAPAADLTLATLLHDAIRTVQQERGTAAARAELERVRRAQLLEDPDSAARGQLAVVLDLLGEATPARALATTR